MKKFFGFGLVAAVIPLVLFYFVFPESVFRLARDAQQRTCLEIPVTT